MTSADHHVQGTIGTFAWASGQGVQLGVMGRLDASADQGYSAFINAFSANTQLRVSIGIDNAGLTFLASGSALGSVPVAGDIIKLVCAGGLLTAYLNGVSQCSVTDTTYTGVRAGVNMLRSTASPDCALSELRFGA